MRSIDFSTVNFYAIRDRSHLASDVVEALEAVDKTLIEVGRSKVPVATLRSFFDTIVEGDWKREIRARVVEVPVEELGMVMMTIAVAIEFFTGTKAYFPEVGIVDGRGAFAVHAEGYRKGPCGP